MWKFKTLIMGTNITFTFYCNHRITATLYNGGNETCSEIYRNDVCELTNLGSSIKKKLARQMAVSIFLHERGSNLGVIFFKAR